MLFNKHWIFARSGNVLPDDEVERIILAVQDVPDSNGTAGFFLADQKVVVVVKIGEDWQLREWEDGEWQILTKGGTGAINIKARAEYLHHGEPFVMEIQNHMSFMQSPPQ